MDCLLLRKPFTKTATATATHERINTRKGFGVGTPDCQKNTIPPDDTEWYQILTAPKTMACHTFLIGSRDSQALVLCKFPCRRAGGNRCPGRESNFPHHWNSMRLEETATELSVWRRTAVLIRTEDRDICITEEEILFKSLITTPKPIS